jgi:TPR repeat protein
MKAQRATTVLSIVGGGALGALAALYGSGSRFETRLPARPLATNDDRGHAESPLTESETAEPEATAVVVATASAALPVAEPDAKDGAVPDAWGEIPEDLESLSQGDAEAFCGMRSVPRACLTAARAHDSSDPVKAREFRLLALSLFIEQCTARDPEACYQLATLYDQGVAVPENTESPTVLRTRARELCAERATPFCTRLAAGQVK